MRCVRDRYDNPPGGLRVANDGYLDIIRSGSVACPPNATGTTTCTCNTGYVEGAGPLESQLTVTRCEVAPPVVCPDAGTPHVASGTLAAQDRTTARTSSCVAGCLIRGSAAGETATGQVYIFPPFTHTGENCEPNEEQEGDEEPPTLECPLGQVPTFSGCSTPPVRETPPTVTENPDGTSTETGTSCTGTECTTTTRTRDGEGNVTSTTTTQQGIREYCAANPNTFLCADIGSLPGGGGGDGAGTCTGSEAECACQRNPSGAGCGGAAAAVGDFREGEGESLTDILGDFRTAALATDVGSAAGAFFTVSVSASCPTYTATIPIIGSITFDQLCSSLGTTVLLALRVAFLIVCGWFAFRVAFDN